MRAAFIASVAFFCPMMGLLNHAVREIHRRRPWLGSMSVSTTVAAFTDPQSVQTYLP